jgi:aldose 1-epimerase
MTYWNSFLQQFQEVQRSSVRWKIEKTVNILFLVIIAIGMISCVSKNTNHSGIGKQLFGTLPDGHIVHLYTLKNRNGMQVKISDYGCIIQSIIVPDRNEHFDDVILGFDSLQGYLKNNLYFGSIVGRYANRISNGKFTLESREYSLEQNSFPNHLHGGVTGFDKVLWNAKEIISLDYFGLQLTFLSPDGDQGYPGELKVTTTYKLNNNNELEIRYEAVTSKPTIINLTNHTYFNLKDGGQSSISDHILVLNADRFALVNKFLIPKGEFRNVEGTPMNFRKPVSIGKRIGSEDEQIEFGNGYDHSWVVNRTDEQLIKAATVSEPVTGRILEVWTTQPAIHLYTGNFLDGTFTGKAGTVYQKRNGFCLETQHFADSPNHPNFPSTILKPGEKYDQRTVYKFKIGK